MQGFGKSSLHDPKVYKWSTILNMFWSGDVYRYQKSIRYVSSIHCFDTRYVSSILICSKHQDKQVPVLMTGPPEPHFSDSPLVRNGT